MRGQEGRVETPSRASSFCPLGGRRTLTSFGLEVGYAVHDDVMQEQRLVVDFYVPGEKAVEVSHVPAEKGKFPSEVFPKQKDTLLTNIKPGRRRIKLLVMHNMLMNQANFLIWKLNKHKENSVNRSRFAHL